MTGISVNALSKMGKNRGAGAKQITYGALEKLYKALDCSVGELLVYIPHESWTSGVFIVLI